MSGRSSTKVSWSLRAGLVGISTVGVAWGLVMAPQFAEGRMPAALGIHAPAPQVASAGSSDLQGAPAEASEALQGALRREANPRVRLLPEPDLDQRLAERLLAASTRPRVAAAPSVEPPREVAPAVVAPMEDVPAEVAPDVEPTGAAAIVEVGPPLSGAGAAPERFLTSYESLSGQRVAREDLFGKLHHPLVKGRVVTRFGTTTALKTRTKVRHTGWTVRAPGPHRVRVAMDGEVVYAGWFRGYGVLVVVDHGGEYHSVYAHLEVLTVKEGAVVKRGDPVGVIGDTGSLTGDKLYFEWRHRGRPVDPDGWFVPPHLETI